MKLATLLLLALSLSPAAPAFAMTAKEVMQAVDDRDDGDRSVRDMEMILIDKNENRRVRIMRSWGRDVGEDEHTIMFFLSPADVEDTGFLTYDYDSEKDDDQWLYLPALHKTKRIASSDKSGSFMGSDFSYADLTDREVDRYDWTMMEEEVLVRGEPCWQIQGIPNTQDEIDETGYTKMIVFVRKDNFVMVRAISWLEKGGRLKYMDAAKLERIDGIWVATEMHMATKKGKKTLHRTVLHTRNVKFDQDLDEDLFSVRRLEKGL
ncbi:MAG: outer membrane lipoprotein-sorting protein [Myxococcota bacterium]